MSEVIMAAPKQLNVPTYEIDSLHPDGNYQQLATLQKQNLQVEDMETKDIPKTISFQHPMDPYQKTVKQLVETENLQDDNEISVSEDEVLPSENHQEELLEENSEEEKQTPESVPNLDGEQDALEDEGVEEYTDDTFDYSDPVQYQKKLDEQATAAQAKVSESDTFDMSQYQNLAKFLSNDAYMGSESVHQKYYNVEATTNSLVDVAIDDVNDFVPREPDEIEIEDNGSAKIGSEDVLSIDQIENKQVEALGPSDEYPQEAQKLINKYEQKIPDEIELKDNEMDGIVQEGSVSIEQNEYQPENKELESRQVVDYPREALELVNRYEQGAASWEAQQATMSLDSIEFGR